MASPAGASASNTLKVNVIPPSNSSYIVTEDKLFAFLRQRYPHVPEFSIWVRDVFDSVCGEEKNRE